MSLFFFHDWSHKRSHTASCTDSQLELSSIDASTQSTVSGLRLLRNEALKSLKLALNTLPLKTVYTVLGLFFALGVFLPLQAQTTQTFNYTGEVQTFVVPSGVTSVHVVAFAATGGNGNSDTSVGLGGKGGKVEANLAVTPGQALHIYVGGKGIQGGAGGYNGGGGPGANVADATGTYTTGGGGGATDIRIGGYALINRVLVAGGGGGAGGDSFLQGGAGGGLIGANGTHFYDIPAGGGTQSAGGSGPFPGALGLGGAGSVVAGGGGGYYGGGGIDAYEGGSGGGGSSFTDPSLCTNVVHTQGNNNGDGVLTITYQPPVCHIGPKEITVSGLNLADANGVYTPVSYSSDFMPRWRKLGLYGFDPYEIRFDFSFQRWQIAHTSNITVAYTNGNSDSFVNCNNWVGVSTNGTPTLTGGCGSIPAIVVSPLTLAEASGSNGGKVVSIASAQRFTRYQLRKDNVNVGSPITNNTDCSTVTFPEVTTAGVYSVIATSTLQSSKTAVMVNTIEIANNSCPPSVSIAANPGNSITSGTSVTFTATPTNGGTTPSYQWKKNNANVGINSATYTDAALADGDVIKVEMTSSDACASPTTAMSNNITMVVSAPSPPGAALHFDGVNDHVVTTLIGPSGNSARTVEAWVRTSNTTANGVIMDWGNTGDKTLFRTVITSDGRVRVTHTTSPSVIGFQTDPYNVNDGNWHYVAATYDPDNNNAVTVSIDGNFTLPFSFSNPINTTSNEVHIGRARASVFPFLGEIDEVRIWNRALSQCEILNNYNCELFDPTDQNGLLAYYQFNQGSAGGNNASVTSLNDASGNNQVGTLTNFALSGATSNWTAASGVTTGTTCNEYVVPVPAVTIAANPGNSITAGTSVTFTATPTNGGTEPSYQWKKNNTDVGTNSATYTDAALADGDVIKVEMTSNDNCASPAMATSNSITMVVSCLGTILNIDVTNTSAPNCQNTTCSSDDTYTADLVVTYQNKPSSGTLTITGPTIVGTLAPVNVADIGTNEYTFTGVTIAANGDDVELSASFSEGCDYSDDEADNAPSCSSSTCAITSINLDNASNCINPNNTNTASDDYFTANVIVNFAFAPAGGTLTLKRGTTIVATTTVDLTCTTTHTFNNVQLVSNGETVILTAEFSTGCSFTSNALMTAPTACSCAPLATCKPASVNLSVNGSGSINATNVFDSEAYNCGTVTPTIVSPSAFNCTNLGANTVTLTVIDINGSTATCTATVTVFDITPPSLMCKFGVTVSLSNTGTGNLTTAHVFSKAMDNCGTVNQVSVVPSAFNCSNLGANIVTLTVNDGNGNTSTCTTSVNVIDGGAPNAICQNVSKVLSSAGTATITAAEVNNGSSDLCSSIANISVNQTNFNCSNVGANTVVLTVTDAANNTGTCTATITIAAPVNVGGACTPPTVVPNPVVNGNSVTFNWISGCHQSYRLQYRRTIPANASWSTKIVNAPGNTTSALMPSTGTYRWGLVGSCPGVSQFSVQSVGNNYVIGGASGLQANVPEFVTATVWPNPTKSMLNVSVNPNTPGTCLVRMFDSMGRVLVTKSFFAEGTSTAQLPVEEIISGMYYVQIVMAGQDPITKTVIVQH